MLPFKLASAICLIRIIGNTGPIRSNYTDSGGGDLPPKSKLMAIGTPITPVP